MRPRSHVVLEHHSVAETDRQLSDTGGDNDRHAWGEVVLGENRRILGIWELLLLSARAGRSTRFDGYEHPLLIHPLWLIGESSYRLVSSEI